MAVKPKPVSPQDFLKSLPNKVSPKGGTKKINPDMLPLLLPPGLTPAKAKPRR